MSNSEVGLEAPKQEVSLIISGPNENSQKASISVDVLAACSQDRICVNEHQNTRPERNLEKLEHEPEKCVWKTTGTQKMRSRRCRAGPKDATMSAKDATVVAPTAAV